jgi:3-hydroxyisobutyrate dehydrogenase
MPQYERRYSPHTLAAYSLAALRIKARADMLGASSARVLQLESINSYLRGCVMHYAFIGVGRLGAILVGNLLQCGFVVTVYDVDENAARAAATKGALVAVSPGEAAADADAVITCLPSPTASAEVLLGPTGALATLRPGGTWIEMSTSDPAEIKRLSEIASGKALHTLEAPITGGIHRAAAGKMTTFVGGEESVYAEHLPALRAMCGTVLYMGPLGAGTTIKLITNMLCFIQLVATGQAFMLAKRSGLDLGRSEQAPRTALLMKTRANAF